MRTLLEKKNIRQGKAKERYYAGISLLEPLPPTF